MCAWPLWKLKGRPTRYPRQLSSGSRGCLCGQRGPAWHEWKPCIEDLTGARSHNTGAFHEQPRNRGGIERDWWLSGRRGVWWARGISGTTLLLPLTLPWLEGGERFRCLLSEEKTRRVILSIAQAALTFPSPHGPSVSVQGCGRGTECEQGGEVHVSSGPIGQEWVKDSCNGDIAKSTPLGLAIRPGRGQACSISLRGTQAQCVPPRGY